MSRPTLEPRDKAICALYERLRSPYIGLTRRVALEAVGMQHHMTPERAEQIIKKARPVEILKARPVETPTLEPTG